jgi:hypothetical protein
VTTSASAFFVGFRSTFGFGSTFGFAGPTRITRGSER